MFTVNQAKQQPGGVVIPAIRGIIDDVQTQEQITRADSSPTTRQGFKFKSEDGKDWMFATAYGRDDLSQWAGQVVVLASFKGGNGRFTGVTLKEKPNPNKPQYPYKNLQITGTAVIHTPETYAAVAPKPQQAQPRPAQNQQQVRPSQPGQRPAANTAQQTSSVINGQTVGMAIKAAVDVWNSGAQSAGEEAEFDAFVYRTASDIIRISQRLERGDLFQEGVAEQPEPVQAKPAPTRPNPNPQPGPHGQAFDPNDPLQDNEDEIPF